MADTLDPLRVPLVGSHLIEASAGTGKTWTIAALYLRLVLGHGGRGAEGSAFSRPLVPAEILVMTFTVAATRELSDRIRTRLVEAAQCFRGEHDPQDDDAFLRELVADHAEGDARAAAAGRLWAAAEAMDEAAVHTIDAWCQRVLREHAVDSGSLFDETLLADENAHVDDAARDYWRRNVYPLAGAALGRVLDVWPDAGALIDDVGELLKHDIGEADTALSLDAVRVLVEGDAPERMRQLKAGWTARVQSMRGWFDAQFAQDPPSLNRSRIRPEWAAKWCDSLEAWAVSARFAAPVLKDNEWERLSPAGLQASYRKDRRVDVPPWSDDVSALRSALAAFTDPQAAMRRHAAASVRDRVAEIKRRAGTPGFRDLLVRLDGALDGPNGERLRERIARQFPAALIDEFQDTSPLQYRIFERIYRPRENDAATALFLIGDPKQSIFAFRGANIRSYLRAAQATEGRQHRLGTNHRSTTELVDAVNGLFGQAEARSGAGAFRFREPMDPAALSLPFVPVQARGRPERLVSSAGAVAAITFCHDAQALAKSELMRRWADLAAAHIVALLNDAGAGFEHPSLGFVRLRPADIAVLVRKRDEAAEVRAALRRRALASVYLSENDSVFDTPEAADLVRWLRAVATPLDGRRVRAAFATPMMGLPIASLAALAHDDAAYESRVERLRRLHAVWSRQGVLPMLRQALHAFELPARWLREPGGERRLTNVLHLAELLQAASAEVDGEEALIRWLDDRAGRHRSAEEESLARLESDADLIKVVTTYKAKGLEYPVVVLPFGCSYVAAPNRGRFLAMPGDGESRPIVFDPAPADVDAAELERQREDLRLLYVALTRARHALWIGVATGKAKGGLCDLDRSALGYLLGVEHERPVAAAAVAALLAQATQGLASIVVEAAGEPSTTSMQPRGDDRAVVERPPYATRFETDWTIGSFSGLVRDLSALPPVAVPADPALAEELRAAADEPPVPPGARAARHRFPRGALPGTFLHDQLQWLAASRFALSTDPELAARLRRRCERQGWGHRADDVVAWLGEVSTTALAPLGVPLCGVRTALPEMEFWFPSGGVAAARIDAVCREHLLGDRPRPPLAGRTLNGMVMGFADLVFEHGGRYWVLDYKSNALGDDDAAYDLEALEGAMAEHRYDVQAALYLLALHRLLRARLGAAYEPARHLGGAIYLFLRGVRGPEHGCYTVHPSVAMLDALDEAMSNDFAASS